MAIEVKVPGVGESVQEGMIASWSKKSGEWINTDEVLCELETDKASVEVVSEASGVLELLADVGKVVKVGQVIARIDDKAKQSEGKAKEKALTEGVTPPPVAKERAEKAPEPKGEGKPQLEHGPAVRRIVAESGVDLNNVPTKGKGGRVTKADVLSMVLPSETQASAAPSKRESPKKEEAKPQPPKASPAGERRETREPMSMLRRRIAERLVQSQKTAAILTTFNEVDMSAILDMRKKYKDAFEKQHGVKLGFMGFFLKASVFALQQFPRVNAFIDGDDIVYHHYCDIGVAVSTEKGLMVPVVRNVDSMSLAETELAIAALAEKARSNKISVDDLSGGTFTVSNGGVFGSLLSTPIINPPQTAILGMHKTQQRPVVREDGSIVGRPMMYLALSYDHRLVDGKECVQFLVKIKDAIEDPSRLLLGV
ncbi:MAG: 2-oxoglutarate dehydrogenase complex dihydrolipoyllysine-residue succinyltransferase [Deltaproteobacteria bacterium]|nr:2-oxoglutarate dehydrogenase complex dihydrolipoyllysine-residue succinyltransferase [Deltaproteobacteria bacterium]